MNFECFIFDFDGTLARSERAYREAFLHSIKLHTQLDVGELDMSGFWNMTPHEVLGRYGESRIDEMILSFEEHYYANHHHHLAAYEGIVEMLDHLIAGGARIGVVSLKPRRAGEAELDITGLREKIISAVWGDDVERPKPEPDGVLRVMKSLDVDPRRTIVVGDSPSDILMGRRAGTWTAAALWGGASRERLMEHRPDLELVSPADLINIKILEG
ncbi:MAG: HAD-IA family hydrolase [Acidobacteriota bacterium]